MIVSDKMAEEARSILEIAPSLGNFDETFVKTIYKMRALEHHPDRGGSAEAFAAIDRAKHILLAWLERRKTEPAKPVHKKRSCSDCDGRGHVVQASGRPGQKGLRRQCQRCHGSGDADYDTDGLFS